MTQTLSCRRWAADAGTQKLLYADTGTKMLFYEELWRQRCYAAVDTHTLLYGVAMTQTLLRRR